MWCRVEDARASPGLGKMGQPDVVLLAMPAFETGEVICRDLPRRC